MNINRDGGSCWFCVSRWRWDIPKSTFCFCWRLQYRLYCSYCYTTGKKTIRRRLASVAHWDGCSLQCACMQRLPTFIPDVFHLRPGHPCRHNPTQSLKRDQWQAFLIHISFPIALYSPAGFLLIGQLLVGTSWSHCGPYTRVETAG